MNQGQKILLNLLIEVDEICRRNDIEYYLAAGCLLGALRNEGFLPWDDDIDVYITRSNWNKLVKVIEKELPQNRGFVCSEMDPIYGNPIGRYIDTTTTLMMKNQLVCTKACGQMVEFFIFDSMPLSDKGKWEHKRLVKTYCELLNPYFCCNNNILYENPEFDYDFYSFYLKRMQSEGREIVLSELLEKISSVPEEESDAWCMCWGQRNVVYEKSTFGTPKEMFFEGRKFPFPAKPEEVARAGYGDNWMYVPEVAQQVTHNVDGDLTISFQDIADIYKPLINEDEVYNAFENKKRLIVEALIPKNDYQREVARARIACVSDETIKSFNEQAEDLNLLLANQEYEEVKKIIDPFILIQNDAFIKANGLLLPVTDDFLSVVVKYFIYAGQFYFAGRLLKARMHDNAQLSESLKKAKDCYDYCRELSIGIYDKKDPLFVKDVLDNNAARYPIVDTENAQLWCIMQQAKTDEDYENLLKKAIDAEKKYSGNGELIRYKANALWHLGKKEDSKEAYSKAIHNTRNGLVWLEAEKIAGLNAYIQVDHLDIESANLNENSIEDHSLQTQQEESALQEEEVQLQEKDSIESGNDEENGLEAVEHDEAEISETYIAQQKMNILKKILQELDSICRENNLCYSIAGRCAREIQEKGSFPEKFDYLCVAMTQGDIDRLSQIINQSESSKLVLEDINNNNNAVSLTARLVDCSTTQVNAEEYGSHQFYGIHLDIEPIRRIIKGSKCREKFNKARDRWVESQKKTISDSHKVSVSNNSVESAKSTIKGRRTAKKYYKLEKKYRFLDTWSDIIDADGIRCGGFVINRTNYNKVSRFKDFDIERSWVINTLETEGIKLMYCNQFYRRRIRSIHSHNWVAKNEITLFHPFDKVINDGVKKHLIRAQLMREQHLGFIDASDSYIKVIQKTWNSYLMGKDIIKMERQYDTADFAKLAEVVKSGKIEDFISHIEDYARYLWKWRRVNIPVVQIPEMREILLNAALNFYNDTKITKNEYSSRIKRRAIRSKTFFDIDRKYQLALLLQAAKTGKWDLKSKNERVPGSSAIEVSNIWERIGTTKKIICLLREQGMLEEDDEE